MNDGVLTAHSWIQTVSGGLTDSTTYTLSFFAKAKELTWCSLGATNKANETGFSYFNLGTGALGTKDALHSAYGIQAFPNGWYRCWIVFASSTGATAPTVRIELATGDGGRSFTGTVNDSIYVWGAQLEAASFPSSYIPTTTGSVTRNADVLTYPGAGNVDITLGAAYAEIYSTTANVGTRGIIGLDGADGSRILYDGAAAGANQVYSYDGTSNVVNAVGGGDWRTAVRKISVSWGGSARTVAMGGQATAGAFDGTFTAGTNIGIGTPANSAGSWFGTIRNVRIWTRQLSDAQLQALTA